MIEKKLKTLISLELGINIILLSNDKILETLCIESLIGTPEEDNISKDIACLTPSVCYIIIIFFKIEEEFNIQFTEDEEEDFLNNNGKIIDLIELIEKNLKIKK